MNLAIESFAISSPMVLHFPLSKQHKHCFTGLEPGWIFNVCSVTSLRMPGMSKGFHAKMSLLAWRKPASAPSYLEESMVPTRTILPSVLLGSTRTPLEPSADSDDPVNFLASGASSVTSSLRVVSAPKAMIAAA